MNGKLNGAIPETTPNGILYEWQSIPLATFITDSPVDNDANEVENSTTSNPL